MTDPLQPQHIMKVLDVIVFVSVLTGAHLAAQQKSVSGTVYSGDKKHTLTGAKITTDPPPPQDTLSGPDGAYSIDLPIASKVLIFYTASGHNPASAVADKSQIDEVLVPKDPQKKMSLGEWQAIGRDRAAEGGEASKMLWGRLYTDPVATEFKVGVANILVSERPELKSQIPGLADFGEVGVEQVTRLSTRFVEARNHGELSWKKLPEIINETKIPSSVAASVLSENLHLKDKTAKVPLSEQLLQCYFTAPEDQSREVFLRAGAAALKRSTLLKVVSREHLSPLSSQERMVLGEGTDVFVAPIHQVIDSVVVPSFEVLDLGPFNNKQP
jgi:hypothetical protein